MINSTVLFRFAVASFNRSHAVLSAHFFCCLLALFIGISFNAVSVLAQSKTDLRAEISISDPQCAGSAGTASVLPKGGKGKYKFVWSTGSRAAEVSGLRAGTYTVTVSDAAANSLVKTVNIQEPDSMKIPFARPIGGNMDFGWEAKASGGSGNYTYENGYAIVKGTPRIGVCSYHLDFDDRGSVSYALEDDNVDVDQLVKNANGPVAKIAFVMATDENGCSIKRYLPFASEYISTDPAVPPLKMASSKPLVWQNDDPKPKPIAELLPPPPPPAPKPQSQPAPIVEVKPPPPPKLAAPTKAIKPKKEEETAIVYHKPTNTSDILDTMQLQYNARNMPNRIGDRRVRTGKRMYFTDNDIVIKVWDEEVEDGDTISLFLNGEWLLKEHALKSKKTIIKTRLKDGDANHLIFYAHNEGRKPPNTAAIAIFDEHGGKQIVLRGSLKDCDSVNLKVKGTQKTAQSAGAITPTVKDISKTKPSENAQTYVEDKGRKKKGK